MIGTVFMPSVSWVGRDTPFCNENTSGSDAARKSRKWRGMLSEWQAAGVRIGRPHDPAVAVP